MNTIFARSLRLIAVTIALAAFATTAFGVTNRYYSAGISPDSVGAGSTHSFTVTVRNCNNEALPDSCHGYTTDTGQTIKSVFITVPAGFTVHAGTFPTTATSSNGDWSASFAGSTITLLKLSSRQIGPGQTVYVTFDADAPCTADDYEWTTQAGGSDTDPYTPWYTLAGSQPSVEVTGSCEVFTGFETGDYCTIGQGGWHAVPNGNNPGVLLETWFDTVYPSGLVVGDHFTMSFDSAADVRAYLAGNSTPGALDDDYVNPTTDNSSGVFGGQVTALALNVDFNYEGYLQGSEGPVGSLHLFDTGLSLDGSTVTDILDAANTALGGGAGAPPGDYTYSSLNDLVDDLNTSFEYCDPSDWAQQHLRP